MRKIILILYLLTINRGELFAQCNFKTEKKLPDFEFIDFSIGSVAGKWPSALGKMAEKKLLRIQIDPKFVTVNEPFKKKPPIKTEDSLVVLFEEGTFIKLGVEEETKAVYEYGAISYWRYYSYFVLSDEILHKMSKNPIKKVSIVISGKKQQRELNKRQQSRIISAAQCLL